MVLKSVKTSGTHELAIGPAHCKVNVVQNEETPSGFVEGYASVFGNVDLGGDVMEQGAFKKTLKERLKTGDIKLVDSHLVFREGTDAIIGGVTDAKEDQTGLWFKAPFSSVRRAQDIRTKIIEGFLNALSFGFDIIKAEPDKTDPTIRRVKEVRLYEISIVPWGMNPKAQLTLAKGAMPMQNYDTSGGMWNPEQAHVLWVEHIGGGVPAEEWTPSQWRAFAKGFLWCDGSSEESIDAYKFLIVEVRDGKAAYNYAAIDSALQTIRKDAVWADEREKLEAALKMLFARFGVVMPEPAIIPPSDPDPEVAAQKEIESFETRALAYSLLLRAQKFVKTASAPLV